MAGARGTMRSCVAWLVIQVASCSVLPLEKSSPYSAESIQLDLASFYNNKAFGTFPGEANFDLLNQSYPAPGWNSSNYTSARTGTPYLLPGYTGPGNFDNIICDSQTIPVPSGSYFSVSFLVAGDLESATVSANATFTYSDNTTSQYELRSLNFYNFLTIFRGEIILPYRFTHNNTNHNTTHIFERTGPLDVVKTLTSITLPSTTNATVGRLHVFAVTLWEGSNIGIQSVRPTQKWIGNGTQVVEVTVNNAGTKCVAGPGLHLSLTGPGFTTTSEGVLKRLCPGDQKVVLIGVNGSSNGSVPADLVIRESCGQRTVHLGGVEIGLTEWTSSLDSLAQHESPEWFNYAKFGIMIHWGPYAATGWGNSSPHESYAEWFWWYSNNHPQVDPSDVYDYRKRTFGANWTYDDTFAEFTAAKYDPKEWVDLFAEAGAKYFVITSKHHDGFAIFNTTATNRSAIHYGPKRDLLGELFDAAATYYPEMKRGTYFSLPEWYNPDFGPYGFWQFDTNTSVSWPGWPATNPYTGVEEPYTGRIPVDDFITDLMVPQMEALAYEYGTDIMWCDCGAANGTAEFAASWWNKARAQNRQVAINSRCGIPEAADFDTPEYATFSSVQTRKWESNQGMDPYSYGYNRATKDSAYMNSSTIIYNLVDMVSKNGNFLLDVGPRADGTIVQAEMDNLREAGTWIRTHGEAIFNTTYWFVQTEIVADGTDIRFTQTDDAFYILFLTRPDISEECIVSVAAPVPILKGDDLSLLAVDGGDSLDWEVEGKGSSAILKIRVSEELLDAEETCWVFKVQYK